MCESGGCSVRLVVVAEVSYCETAVAPKWGAAPIHEDGLQKGLPVGAFSVLQPQGKGQD